MPTQLMKDRVPSGFTLRYTLRGNSGAITRMAWSTDGHVLASPSYGRTIQLWDMQTGQLLRTLVGHTDVVNGVSWSPNNRFLSTCSNDRSIRLWDTNSGTLLKTLTGHSDWVRSVVWSPDGKFLCTGYVRRVTHDEIADAVG
jgi:WD40 repeat protein